MRSFKKYILLEKVFGNAGWVYHRTRNNPEDSDIVKYGIKPSSNQSAMYGKGLYCCYDFEEQLKPNMEKYGEYILKGKIDLNNFAILDSDVYWLANPKGNFQEHLEQIGTNIESVKDESPYTSGIAGNIWRKCKQNGYNGIVFTGRTDGKVAVIWNRENFTPYQYTEDNGRTWTKLNIDIRSIKRPHDLEYDKDDEKIDFIKKILKELSHKKVVKNIILPDYFTGNIILRNVKECEGDIISASAKTLDLRNLQTCGGDIRVARVTTLDLRNLQTCGGHILAHFATTLDLNNLQECGGDINASSATTIDLSNLQKCGGYIYAYNAEKIIISKRASKSILESSISPDCEIIHPEEQNIKVNENVTFKKYLMLKESQVQIPLEKAYEIFKNEYDKSTGKSWDYNKFMGRARNWEFYGDDNGYVAIRRQRSGLVKLVGMAGSGKSKLKGINDLVSMNLPLWGMVSKDIKDIAVKRGMREPNFLERQVLKRSIPPEVLGGAEILDYQKDGGVKLRYPDVGEVVKYLVGTPQYYSELKKLFGDKLKEKILG